MIRPPSPVARWLLRTALPEALRDDVAANLDDLHLERARRLGQHRADLWYWRQAVAFPLRMWLSGHASAERAPRPRRPFMRTLFEDLSYAWRLHRRQPGVALAALASLAIGIGLNTAIFSVVDGVLLRPAPIADFDRLVMVWETDRDTGTTREPGSVPDFVDYRERTRTLDALGAFMATEVNFARPGEDPTRLAALLASPDLLPMLGVRPIVGRTFTAADERPNAEPVAIVSASLWARAFNRDPGIVGRTLRVDDRNTTIVGVVPDSTDFGVLQVLGAAAYGRGFVDRGVRTRVDVWAPLPLDPTEWPRSTHPALMIGRLAPGSDVRQAAGEMTRIAADLETAYPRDNDARGAHVEALGDVVFGPVRPALLALLGAVGLVLVVACANVANLLLARGVARQREVAIRAALGAGRGRVVRQFLTEALGLSMAGGVAGVAVAYGALRWFVARGPADVPRLASAVIDLRVLAVTFTMSVAVGLLFGVFPALQASRARPRSTLAGQDERSLTSAQHGRLRSALVVAELALACVLVVGAGLLIRSVWLVQRIDPGFRSHGVLKAEYQLPAARYPVDFAVWPNFKEIHAFNRVLLDRARAIPGVTSVAIAGNHPLDPGFTNSFAIAGREAEARNWPEISVRRVTPGYFDTVGLRLSRGRLLDAGDTTDGALVALVNEAAAARFFPDQDPLGHEVLLWGGARRIVGIVANEKFQGVTAAPPLAVYLPLSQAPSTTGAEVLLLRTSADPASLANSAREAIRSADPALAVFGVEPLDETLARSVGERRFTMMLLALFAAMALVLAAVGIHGVLGYSVTQRTREIGIRVALGAEPTRLRRLILRQGLVLAATGVAVGMLAALYLARLIRALLYAVEPADPLTLGGVAVVLLVVAAAASYLPARRATRIDPASALRA